MDLERGETDREGRETDIEGRETDRQSLRRQTDRERERGREGEMGRGTEHVQTYALHNLIPTT